MTLQNTMHIVRLVLSVLNVCTIMEPMIFIYISSAAECQIFVFFYKCNCKMFMNNEHTLDVWTDRINLFEHIFCAIGMRNHLDVHLSDLTDRNSSLIWKYSLFTDKLKLRQRETRTLSECPKNDNCSSSKPVLWTYTIHYQHFCYNTLVRFFTSL